VQRALAADGPDLLIKLVRETWNNEHADLLDLAQRLQGEPDLWRATLGNELVVRNGAPFVDRRAFKDALPGLLAPDGPACLVVFGDRGAGRTYLSEYCASLAAGDEALRVAHLDLAHDDEELLALVAADAALGLEMVSPWPDRHADPHRWAHNLAAWLAFESPLRARPGLLLLDSMDRPTLPEPFHTLVADLIRSLQTNERCRRRLRVVLLGYDTARLEKAGLPWTGCSLEVVTAQMLEAWFQERYPDLAPYRYEEAARAVQEAIPEGGPVRMKLLRVAVQRVCPELERLIPGGGG
jgi:hypothetical protein